MSRKQGQQDNAIDVFKAQGFRIASAATQLENPRMFVLTMHHRDYGACVRVRLLFRQAKFVHLPEYEITSMRKELKIKDSAKHIFETKALNYANFHRGRQ